MNEALKKEAEAKVTEKLVIYLVSFGALSILLLALPVLLLAIVHYTNYSIVELATGSAAPALYILILVKSMHLIISLWKQFNFKPIKQS